MKEVVTLLLVGLSVGLGNFAASVAIGLGGVTKKLRIRIAIVFGIFETGMPIIGLLIGQRIAHDLGGKANIIGGLLLGLTGIYLIISSLRKSDDKDVVNASKGWAKLIFTGLALSIDNLIIGFGLGTHNQPILLSAIVIGTISIGLALIGLELGNKLNSKVGSYSEILSGVILIFVGLLIALKVL